MEDVGDDRVSLDRRMPAVEHIRCNAGRIASGAPDFNPVVEDSQRDRAAGNRVVPMDERIHQDFPHGIGRDKRRIHALKPPGNDLAEQREVPLAEQLRLFEQLEGWGMDLALVDELRIVSPPKPSHAQLALRVVGQEFLPEQDHGGLQHPAVTAHPQAIEDVHQPTTDWFDEAARRSGEIHDPQRLLPVNVPQFHALGRLVLPAAMAVRAFQQQPLVLGLGHSPRRAGHTLVGSPLVSKRSRPGRGINRHNDDFMTRSYAGTLNYRMRGRLEPIQRPGYIAQRLVGNLLALSPSIRPHAEEHRAAGAVQEGAHRLHTFLEFTGRTLELQRWTFSLPQESGELPPICSRRRHASSIYGDRRAQATDMYCRGHPFGYNRHDGGSSWRGRGHPCWGLRPARFVEEERPPMKSHASCHVRTRLSDGPLGKRPRHMFLAWSLLGVLAAGSVESAVVRIMPLGDSITVGIGDGGNGGYRGPLYQMLTSAGQAVDFVGSQTGGSIPDPNNEGHSGWRADQIRDNITAWLTATPPDFILLHIGTNDITQGQGAAGTVAEIGQILDLIDAYETTHHVSITVVLARIVNRSNPLDALGLQTTSLNASIASMANTRIAAGDRLVVVDQESALSYPGDMADTVHPNASGYAKMATVWYGALQLLLGNKGDFVSDTIPKAMIPGTSYDCSITMRNSGYKTWLCSPAGTMLTVGQTNGPVANKLIPYPYYEIYTNPCQIDIGQLCTFPFTVSVPGDTPLGEYEIRWQMKDNSEWFDTYGHDAVFRKTVPVRLYPFYKGDFDDDGDVDQDDFGHLQACFSRMGYPQDDPSCADARLDGDFDVDQQDLAIFRQCMNGANTPPGSSCIR